MYILLAAVILDLLIGDPRFYPHPVVLVGRIISYGENILRKSEDSLKLQKIKGIILVILTLSITFAAAYLLLSLMSYINYYLGLTFKILLLYTTIAVRGLHQAAWQIFRQLKNGKLKSARQSLDMIVGRETSKLDTPEIIRAVVETVAENTSDGIIAPIFYFLIGGPILALLYKAVNTMDSMLGYKNEKYQYFGWAAAKLDDIVNYLPARLTALFIILVAFLLNKDYKKAWQIVKRDAQKHDSPNAGYPEAAVAGALQIRLGGVNKYFGYESKKAYLGDKLNDFKVGHIKEAVILMHGATYLFIGASTIIKYLIG